MASVVSRIEFPETASAGAPCTVRISLRPRDASDEIGAEIDGVEIALVARAYGYDGKWLETLMRIERTPAASMTIPPAGATFEETFDLPEDAPPTYEGGLIFAVSWHLEVHVRAPWWRSLHENWPVRVARKPSLRRPAPAPTSVAFPSFDRPFLEIALDDVSFAPGEAVTGAFAVGNLARAQYVELCLVTRESIRHGVFQTFEGQRHVLYRDLIGVEEGHANTFHLSVPASVPPRFVATGVTVEWMLEASIDGARGGDECWTIPIVIDAFEGEREEATTERAPIGRARWIELWRTTAVGHGWTSTEPAHMERAFEACRAVVAPGPENEGIRAELRWTDWELGMSAAPPDHVEGRERDQVRAVIALLEAPLAAFDAAEISDAGATLTIEASPWDADRLLEVLEKIESLADAIARATNAIPPPRAMAPHLDAWRDARRAMGGRLCVGSMSLRDLSVDGIGAAIETTFDRKGAPHGTNVVVRTEGRVPKTLVGVDQRLGDRVVRVEPDALVLALDEFTTDPIARRSLLDDLVALLRTLGGGGVQGPYR